MQFPEVGLAFLEGLALIVSPCILPVLPLVLSSSIDGGRRRPYGIITGFIVAFSLFVLGSRALVNALHIDLDIIKYGSLALLFLFGLVLLSEKLSSWFGRLTQGAADFGSRVGAKAEGGFFSGIGIGALIGLVWTPCAGPILAAVLVQVIRQRTDIQGVLVTLAFAVGASIPMLIIALAGRKIMGRLRFFTGHAEAVRKVFGVIIILAVALMAFGSGAQSSGGGDEAAQAETPVAGTPPQLEDGLKEPYPAPDFTGLAGWLNSEPLTMSGLKGRVVLVDFWTYSCINCARALPYITAWDKRYRNDGLVIVGVHSPEFEFEKKTDNIKTAIARYGIAYPVAVDNDLATWVSFANRYWPAHYLIDREGKVVYVHFGEGKYDVTENNIRYLLGLTKKAEAAPPEIITDPGQTPETYLGTARAERFLGTPNLQSDKVANYRSPYPESMMQNHWALRGKWKAEAQKIVSQEQGATLQFHFEARKVFLVMGTASGKPAKVMLKLNGAAPGDQGGKDVADGRVTVDGHALYELINQHAAGSGLLEITAQEPGVEMYAFTFGG